MLYDVFLSHSREDIAWAQQLYARLRRFRIVGRPIRVFFAPAAISPGQSIPRVLAEALNACQHLLVVVTPAWLESEWCRLEEDVAVWREPGARERILLPLLLKPCTLPPTLSRLKHVDFKDNAAYEIGIREIVDTIRRGAQRAAEEHHAGLERSAILNSPILPWLGFGGPSFDFVWPEMIIDPLVSPRKHPGPNQRLSEWLRRFPRSQHACIAVVGEAGGGKTTALRTMLLTGGGALPEKRVFLHAREIAASAPALIAKANSGEGHLAVIVDGLDEAGTDHIGPITAACQALQRPGVFLIIASRRDFFDRQYDLIQPKLSNLIEILELCAWGKEDVLEFVGKYGERVDNPVLEPTVQRILEDVPGAHDMLSNPMRLTLLLYLLMTGARVDPVDLREPYSLYRTFYTEWIRKEHSRGTGGFKPAEIREAHTIIARWLYENKGDTCNLADFFTRHSKLEQALMTDSAFAELLVTDRRAGGESLVLGFRHETISEFLIAQDIVVSFRQGGESINAALRYTVADDVNAFVRSSMTEASRPTVQRYLANLSGHYQSLLPPNDSQEPPVTEDDMVLRLREQLLYYIGRLPVEIFPDILRYGFTHERHPLLRRSAALGAIIHGDAGIEAAYLTLLYDPEENLLNRSVQMVYFGDVHGDLHTFRESGEDWSRTRLAIYRRLRGTSLRDLRLRLWDMRTLRSFYESRGHEPTPSKDELEVLASVAIEDSSSAERTAAFQQEHAALMAGLGRRCR